MANNQLVELIDKFRNDQTGENFSKMMEVLENSTLILPATMPENLSPQMRQAARLGKAFKVDKNNPPQTLLLNGPDGGKLIPAFTDESQIPKERMPQAKMVTNFRGVVSMAINNKDMIKGIALNPFTQVVVLNEKTIEIAESRFQAAASALAANKNSASPISVDSKGVVTKQVTEKEFHTITHTKVARGILPDLLFENTEKAIADLRVGKEQFILDLYKKEYGHDLKCPYTEDDFAIMMLQIADDLLIVRIDMPEENMVAGGAAKIYLAYEGTDKLRYFIVEKALKDSVSKICEVDKNNGYVELMEAPDNGAEVETIISLARPS